MSQLPPLPPPLPLGPPPLPPHAAHPAPLPYATYAPPQADFYQQAARASWIAPLIVVVLGLASQSATKHDRTSTLIIGGVNALLILIGFVLAIVALIGTRKRGTAGVLMPAIIGLVINGLLLAALIPIALTLSGLALNSSAPTGPIRPAVSPSPAEVAADLKQANEVTVNLDGQTISVPGRFMTAAEKRALIEAGQRQNGGQQR